MDVSTPVRQGGLRTNAGSGQDFDDRMHVCVSQQTNANSKKRGLRDEFRNWIIENSAA